MKEQATIQSLQEAIEETNDGIIYAENLIATTAENDAPSPTIGNEVPVEKIIEEITNFGNIRSYMVEETRNFVLPELNAIKERRISAQEKLLEQAGMNFRQALELKAAGVLGETEIQIIEEALARLPDELSERIKNPIPKNPEPEPTLDVKKRGIAGIFRRNAVETSAINTAPQTPKYEVTVPDGFESVLHHPIRQIESDAETVAAPTEEVKETIIPAGEPEMAEEWNPEEYEIVSLDPIPQPITKPSLLEAEVAEVSDSQTDSDEGIAEPYVSESEIGTEQSSPNEELAAPSERQVVVIAEVEELFKRAPRLKEAFYFTYNLTQFTVEDLIKELFSEAIAKGETTQSQAKHNIEANIIPRLLSRDYSFGKYEKERDGHRMIYKFVGNDSAVNTANHPSETATERFDQISKTVEDLDTDIDSSDEGPVVKPREMHFPDSESLGIKSGNAQDVYAALVRLALQGKTEIKGPEIVQEMFGEDINSGKISQQKADAVFHNGMRALRNGILREENPLITLIITGQTRKMTYTLLPNESSPKDDYEKPDADDSKQPDNVSDTNPFREGTGPRMAYDSLRASEVALSYEEWALDTYSEQLANGDLTLQEAVNNLNKIVTRSLRTMDPMFGELIVSRRYGDVTRFLLKAPNTEPDLDTDKPEDEVNQDIEQSADSENIEEIIPAVDTDIEQKSPTLPPRDFHLTPRQIELDDLFREEKNSNGISKSELLRAIGIKEGALSFHLSTYGTVIKTHGYKVTNLIPHMKGEPIYKLEFRPETDSRPEATPTYVLNDSPSENADETYDFTGTLAVEDEIFESEPNEILEAETEADLDSIEPADDEETSLQEPASNLDPEKSPAAFIALDAGVTLNVNHGNGLSEAETVEKEVDEWQETKNEDGSCRHKWIIDTPNGPGESAGKCSRCGVEKGFKNYIEPNYTDKLPAAQQKAVAKGISEIQSLIREAERQIY